MLPSLKQARVPFNASNTMYSLCSFGTSGERWVFRKRWTFGNGRGWLPILVMRGLVQHPPVRACRPLSMRSAGPRTRRLLSFLANKICLPAKAGIQTGLPPSRENKGRAWCRMTADSHMFQGDKCRTCLDDEMGRAEFGRERFRLFERGFGGDQLIDGVGNWL